MEVLASISNALSLVKRLREISKNITNAEFKNLLADLSSQLADAKLEGATLKEQIAALRTENLQLRSVQAPLTEKPIGTKYGCYKFEGDDGLYCTGCWDSNKKKSRTNRVNSKFRSCPVCKAQIGT